MKLISLLTGPSQATKILGAASLSMIALVSIPDSTKAATVVAGSDYWITQDSSSFDFGGDIGVVQFIGDPIGEFMGIPVGNADTIVQRLNDADLSNGSGTTGLQIQALSLKSINPVNGFDVFVGLTEGVDQAIGTLTINENNTFESIFTVDWTATFVDISGGGACPLPSQTCSFGVTELMGEPTLFEGDGNWSGEFQGGTKVEGPVGDLKANVHTDLKPDQSDFFVVGTVMHNGDGAGHHDVSAVPEPLTILGSGMALGFGVVLKRKASRRQKGLQPA